MSAPHAVLGFVLAARLAELAFAARNTRRLRAMGAIEVGAGHYPLFIALHAGWWGALAVLVPADAPANPLLLGVFVALQAARLWVIASLGARWTTRVLALPGADLVRRGPYRYLRHPNYAIVCAEIAVVPLMFGAHGVALVFSLLNALLLGHRIRVENLALGREKNNEQ